MGVRIPHRKTTLINYGNHRGYAVSSIKFSYMVNPLNHQKNVGSLSWLIDWDFDSKADVIYTLIKPGCNASSPEDNFR